MVRLVLVCWVDDDDGEIKLNFPLQRLRNILKQLIQIIVVGIDVRVCAHVMWEENKEHDVTRLVRLADHMTISRADAGYRTWFRSARNGCVTTAFRDHDEWFMTTMKMMNMNFRYCSATLTIYQIQ